MAHVYIKSDPGGEDQLSTALSNGQPLCGTALIFGINVR